MSASPPSDPVVFAGSAAFARHRDHGAEFGEIVLTIGNFDGVHKGHHHLLGEVVAAAQARGAKAVVYTFDPPPRSVLAPGLALPRITAWPDRVRLLGEAGVDAVVVERFTRAFAQHTPEWFADEILGRRLAPREIVVGYDFRFGKARAGTLNTVQKRLVDTPARAVQALKLDGTVVSSSEVRRRVQAGDVAGAADLLGRPHLLRGVVVPGHQRGRTLGFPTANVETDAELLPPPGVYAVRARVDGGKWCSAVANLGNRPTFEARGAYVVEVHLLDFKGDIYGAELEVALVDKIRAERKFDGLDALTTQIRLDAQAARARLAHDT